MNGTDLRKMLIDSTSKEINRNSKKRKNISIAYFTAIQIISRECRYGRTHNTRELRQITGFSKQRLNYCLVNMCEDGILKRLDKGLYRITESGKRIYDQYERLYGKQLVRIENMHVSYPITGDLGPINIKSNWKRAGLRNSKVWIGKLKDHTVRLIKTHYGFEFQVYVTKVLGTSPNEAYFYARNEADSIALEVEARGVQIGNGWVSSEPEIAIPSPIASALLMTSGASQIRTDKGIINRSKGRCADWEPRSLQQAQKMADMPDAIDRILEKLDALFDLLSNKNTTANNSDGHAN